MKHVYTSLAMFLILAACTKQQEQQALTAVQSDVTSVGICELNYIGTTLLTGGTPTPEGAVKACDGLLLSDAQRTFATLTGGASDAGVSLSKLRTLKTH